jgi:hypothetical protein
MRFGRRGLRFWLEESAARSWFDLPEGGAPCYPAVEPGAKELLKVFEEAAKAIDAQTEKAQGLLKKHVPKDADEAQELDKDLAWCQTMGASATRALWEKYKPQLEHELLACIHSGVGQVAYSPPIPGSPTESPALTGSLGPLAYRLASLGRKPYAELDHNKWIKGVVGNLQDLKATKNAAGFDLAGEVIENFSALLKRVFWVSAEQRNASSRSDGEVLHDEFRKWQFEKSLLPHYVTLHFQELVCNLVYLWVRRGRLLEQPTFDHHHENRQGRIVTARWSSINGDDASLKTWQQACVLARLSNDLAAHLPPDHLPHEARLRVMGTTLYGLSLGHLHRFYEAHRRFNEAKALLTKGEHGNDSLEFSIVDLRRGEVLLIEAKLLGEITDALDEWAALLKGSSRHEDGRCPDAIDAFRWHTVVDLFELAGAPGSAKLSARKRGQGDADYRKALKKAVERDGENQARKKARQLWLDEYLQRPLQHSDGELWLEENPADICRRLHLARLDAAWLTLENAERLLSGQSHSSLWWSNLHTLQLRLFAEHRFIEDWDKQGRLYRIVAMRRQQSHQNYVEAIFRKGLGTAPENRDHFVRLLGYFYLALRHAFFADKLQRNSARTPESLTRQCREEFRKRMENILASVQDEWACENAKWFREKAENAHPSDLHEEFCKDIWEAYAWPWPIRRPKAPRGKWGSAVGEDPR